MIRAPLNLTALRLKSKVNDSVYISFIESKTRGNGHFRNLVKSILKQGFKQFLLNL